VVVDAGDDLVAGREAGLPHFDLLRAELAFCPHLLPRQRVQLADLGVPLGDHQGVLALAEALPPVGDHRLPPRGGVI
jgi:hypothetical protein